MRTGIEAKSYYMKEHVKQRGFRFQLFTAKQKLKKKTHSKTKELMINSSFYTEVSLCLVFECKLNSSVSIAESRAREGTISQRM